MGDKNKNIPKNVGRGGEAELEGGGRTEVYGGVGDSTRSRGRK
jgi:hypothetical protein